MRLFAIYAYWFIGETYPLRPPSISTLDSNSSSVTSSIPDLDRALEEMHLNATTTDMLTVVRAMARPDSGLEIRDRLWLKITIPNAFIGELCSHKFPTLKYLIGSTLGILVFYLISPHCLTWFQVLMWLTGSKRTLKAFRTKEMLENTLPKCSKQGTSSTLSIKLRFRNSATTLLETCSLQVS